MDILIPIIAIISLFLVPIAGLMLILVTRFAFKPLVESLTQALRESPRGGGAARDRVLELSEQVETLRDEVRRLREAQEFDRQLLASGAKKEDSRG